MGSGDRGMGFREWGRESIKSKNVGKNPVLCFTVGGRSASVGGTPTIIPHPPPFVNRQNAQTSRGSFVRFA